MPVRRGPQPTSCQHVSPVTSDSTWRGASLFRRLWQNFDRNRIDISETVPTRARLLLELRHRPRFRSLLRSHPTLTRKNEPLAIRREPRAVLARRSIDHAHRQRRAPFSILIVTHVDVRAADGIRSIERADEKKFLIRGNESFNINDAFAVNCRSEIYWCSIFLVNEFGHKDVDFRIVIGNRRAEIKIPITRHRSEVLAVRVDDRAQIFRFRPFVTLALGHPDFVMMRILPINRSI